MINDTRIQGMMSLIAVFLIYLFTSAFKKCSPSQFLVGCAPVFAACEPVFVRLMCNHLPDCVAPPSNQLINISLPALLPLFCFPLFPSIFLVSLFSGAVQSFYFYEDIILSYLTLWFPPIVHMQNSIRVNICYLKR